MTISLRQLHHATVLARRGNFHQAAIELGLTQPALTRSIQALEAATGITLFDRLPGGVEPTSAGETLLRKAVTILGETHELEREMALLVGLESGCPTVATGAYPAHQLMPRAVAAWSGKHPRLRCRMVTAKGIYPCPILIEEPGTRMGDRLSDGMRPIRLHRGALNRKHVTVAGVRLAVATVKNLHFNRSCERLAGYR